MLKFDRVYLQDVGLQTLPRNLLKPSKQNNIQKSYKSSLRANVAATDSKLIQEVQKLVDKQPHGRVYNFSAGPATMEPDVLQEIKDELFNYRGHGLSVMEMSHRSKVYDEIHNESIQDLRQLMNIPEDYAVIYVQGGATAQFASVPLNFTQSNDDVLNYLVTGEWTKKSIIEAKKYGKTVNVCKNDFKHIPDESEWTIDTKGKYLYYCDNETINGVEFQNLPRTDGQTLIADMSSNFCSKPVDVSKFGLIYAGVQKNVGPAGVAIVIVRKDLLGKQRDYCPDYFNYKMQAEQNSLLNTPPCFTIYVCGKVFKKLIRDGGLEARLKKNEEKSKLLYDYIDNSNFYVNPVDKNYRSHMNVPFNIPSKPDLEKKFPKEAQDLGLLELKGHRSMGGMRASIYNAMDIDGVRALIAFMKDFQQRYG